MALVCGTCGTELDAVSACAACRASSGLPLEVPEHPEGRVAILPWLRPDAQSVLASGRLSAIMRVWRKFTGVTQSDVASALGYDRTFISMLESERRSIASVEQRRRIAAYLGIAPHVLGVTDAEDADYRAMIAFGESTLRLAGVARTAGRPAAALNELWPLVVRLEGRVNQGHVEPAMLSLLARSRSALGVFLGDILPAQGLTASAQWTGHALTLTEHLADADLHAQALRANGNELRKAGRLDAAVRRLRQAADIASATIRPTVLVALARATAEAGAGDLFDTAVADADQLAHTTAPSPLFNAAIVAEVRLRGLLHLDRRAEAAKLLWRQEDQAAPSAPQWQAISQITTCEAMAATGETAEAERQLPAALAAARACRLPQQVQRIVQLADSSARYEHTAIQGRAALRQLVGSPSDPV